ncbi:MAG: tRNA 2-thiouridine(34) synthase MnmA [Lautropia sp.]|nr:tRNA 2-thiouridine(34) synthase MnmA [Lautropia sp.]
MKYAIPDGEGRQIVVGLSGGVDSAVSAWLLKEAGWQVTGLFMKNWEDDDDSEYCSTRQDLLDAASVADVIGIDLEAVNFAADYRDRVFRIFLEAHEAGLTPNPDVLCNAEIKFKAFLDHALALGADRIATGHYAGNRHRPDGRVELLRGADANKDQSYFLHRLNQYQLGAAVFPLANITKPEVREIAARIGLPNATKKDSTGICFIGERPFREFLSRYLPTQPGPMVDDRGVKVGEHIGLSFYTLGQRKGIGIGGRKDNADGTPWFVAEKNLATNTLVVVRGHDHPMLLSHRLVGRDVHWIGDAPEPGRHYGVKCRYRQADAVAWLEDDAVPPGSVSGAESGAVAAQSAGSGHAAGAEAGQGGAACREHTIQVAFQQPQWAVTPGQSAVFYDGDVCLGGCLIASAGGRSSAAAG